MALRAPNKNSKKARPSRPAQTHLDVTIEGFKSISRRQKLSMKPLTILSGSNSSGKSSFMQPLLMLKQTLEAPYDPGPLLINGPHVKFTSADQFLSELKEAQRTKNFSIKFESEDRSLEINFSRKNEKPIQIAHQEIRVGGESVLLTEDLKFPAPYDTSPRLVMSHLKTFFGDRLPAGHAGVFRERCFFGLGLSFDKKAELMPLPLTGNLLGRYPGLLRSMIHLPGLRGNPERTYPLSAVGHTFPGLFQNYAASIIDSWQEKSKPPLGTLNSYLRDLDLASGITTKKIDETQVELRVDRTVHGRSSSVSIADVGMAVSQILPVLVALATAEPGQLVFIEQPELHLHPRAQFKLARIICAAVERGITLVIETHSSILLLGIQTCIAENIIDHENVALHWFSRDSDGVTCVASASLDAAGSFGDWPEDFGDVSLEAEHHYLSAAEKAAARWS
jgi:predicted ATPase